MPEFTVLGPVGARGPGGEVRLGGGLTVRVVLAMLVLRAGQVVGRDALVDALWPDDPPPGARQTVESYVSRLRRALREAGLVAAAIESAAAGYRLVLDGYAVDRDRFQVLLAAGREARSRGDPGVAAARLGEALALWRGPPLDGLADRAPFAADAAALEQARLLAVEEWAEAQLELGHAGDVVATLQTEAGRHPRRERVDALLMLALYRCGSQAEALEHYAAVRRELVDELGLEPGPALRSMQERILRQDPALEPPRPALAVPALVQVGRRVRRAWVAGALVAFAATAAVVWRGGDQGDPGAAVARGPALIALDSRDDSTRGASALPAAAGGIAAGPGARWVTAPDDGTLMRLDRDGVVTQTVRVGHGPDGVVTTLGDVWVAVAGDGHVVRVDGPSSRVVQRISVGASPSKLVASGGVVWVADGREPTLSRIDAHTGTVIGVTTLRGPAGGLAAGFGAVWATMPSAGRVARLDASTGRVRDEIMVGSGPGPIAAGADGIWIANALDGTVSLVDPERGAVVLTREVRGSASALAASGRRVWVAAADIPALTRLGRDEPASVRALPAAPTALAADGGTVLAAVGPDRATHRGGTLRVQSALRLAEADTHICCNAPPALRNASYDALLGLSVAPGAVGALVPNLALAVPRPQDGGRTYVFRLRPGLRYWTGRPVRASDFRRGIEVAIRASSLLAGYLDALPGARRCARGGCDLRAAIETDDEAGTVTFHLTRPDPQLLWGMALSFFAPAPAGGGPTPGTGPYRIAQLVPDRLIDLRRNPYFHERAPAAAPDGYPDRIVWQLGGEPERSVADVMAGRADYTDDPPTHGQARMLRLDSPDRLHADPVAGDEFAWLNTRARPFDDVRVRRALAFGLDRGALARRWGPGAQPLCQIVPASVPGHVPYCPYTRRPNAAGTWTAPDLAKARALIVRSGTKGMAITYWAKVDVIGKPGLVDRSMAALLRRLGYKVRLRPIRPSTVLGEDFQIGTGSWWADIPSPSQWTELLRCDAPGHDPPRFCDRTVDRWARQAAQLQSTDAAAANRLWARVDRRVTDHAAWIPAVQPAWVSVVSTRVGGYRYVPTIGVLVHRLWVR